MAGLGAMPLARSWGRRQRARQEQDRKEPPEASCPGRTRADPLLTWPVRARPASQSATQTSGNRCWAGAGGRLPCLDGEDRIQWGSGGPPSLLSSPLPGPSTSCLCTRLSPCGVSPSAAPGGRDRLVCVHPFAAK